LHFLIFFFFFFFFQAEDGIRDGHVTGVQTCALPIYVNLQALQDSYLSLTEDLHCKLRCILLLAVQITRFSRFAAISVTLENSMRSEERRVGKECRSWWWTYQ